MWVWRIFFFFFWFEKGGFKWVCGIGEWTLRGAAGLMCERVDKIDLILNGELLLATRTDSVKKLLGGRGGKESFFLDPSRKKELGSSKYFPSLGGSCIRALFLPISRGFLCWWLDYSGLFLVFVYLGLCS